MQIIWDKAAADKLQGSHTLLELETFEVEGRPLTAYCVIPPEKIILDIAQLDNLKELHAQFLKAYTEGNHDLCQDVSEHLIGKFGGELDTFYQELLSRSK